MFTLPNAARRKRRFRAFTLVELIIVIVVMAILVAVGAFAYNSITENSRQSAARTSAEQFGRNAVAVAGAESTGVANLSVAAKANVDDDAAKAGIAFEWATAAADGTVTVEVRKYSYCTPVRFTGTAPVLKYTLGDTVRATTCPWDGSGGSTGPEPTTPTTTPTSTPTAAPTTPAPTGPTPQPALGAALGENDFGPADPVTGLVCPNDDGQLVNTLNASGQTTANLNFRWAPVAGATSYDVHLTPLNGQTSNVRVARNTTTNAATLQLPRALDSWGNPAAGQDTSAYSQYSLRILPHLNGQPGEPLYRVFVYRHTEIRCWSQSESNSANYWLSPLEQLNPNTINASVVNSAEHGDVTLNWAGVSGAVSYRVSIFGESAGNEWSADISTNDPRVTVKFPRTPLDQYGNPVGGTNAPYYDIYWIRIQPVGTDWVSDPRYRKLDYKHWGVNTAWAPESYW